MMVFNRNRSPLSVVLGQCRRLLDLLDLDCFEGFPYSTHHGYSIEEYYIIE